MIFFPIKSFSGALISSVEIGEDHHYSGKTAGTATRLHQCHLAHSAQYGRHENLKLPSQSKSHSVPVVIAYLTQIHVPRSTKVNSSVLCYKLEIFVGPAAAQLEGALLGAFVSNSRFSFEWIVWFVLKFCVTAISVILSEYVPFCILYFVVVWQWFYYSATGRLDLNLYPLLKKNSNGITS